MQTIHRFTILICFVSLVSSIAQADKIWLVNEDSFSGTIHSLEYGVLYLESAILGEIKIPWDRVLTLETESPMAFELTNGDRLTARISKSDHGKIVIQSELFGPSSIETQQIVSIGVEPISEYQTKLEAAGETIEDLSSELADTKTAVKKLEENLSDATDISKLWSGSVTLQGGGKTGNRDAYDLYIKTEVKRTTEQDELTILADFAYGETQNVVETTEGRINPNLRVFFAENIYVYGDLLLEHDRFENLDLRVDGTVGGGYRFWKDDISEFLGEAGAGLSQEIFRSGTDSSDVILRLNIEYSRLLFGKSTFKQRLTVFPSVGQFGEARLISRSSILTPLWDSFSWDVSVIDEFDTDPEPGVESNDVSFRTGLSYTF